MIRHDAPGKEPVALFVEMTERVTNDFRNLRIAQCAGASSAIEIPFDAAAGKLRQSLSLVAREFPVSLTAGETPALYSKAALGGKVARALSSSLTFLPEYFRLAYSSE